MNLILFMTIMAAMMALPAPAQASTNSVYISITGAARTPGFSPDMLTIHINDTVTFVNTAYPAATYTIQADNGAFTSTSIAPGQQWTLTFPATGTYTFHEIGHPATMMGSILVVAASTPLAAALTSAQQEQAIQALKNQGQTSANGNIPTLLVIGIGLLGVLIVASVAILLKRRYKHQQTRNMGRKGKYSAR